MTSSAEGAGLRAKLTESLDDLAEWQQWFDDNQDWIDQGPGDAAPAPIPEEEEEYLDPEEEEAEVEGEDPPEDDEGELQLEDLDPESPEYELEKALVGV